MDNKKNSSKDRKLSRRDFIRNFAVGSAGLLFLGSCTTHGFLNVPPRDQLDKNSFYDSAEKLVTAVNGVYSQQAFAFGGDGNFNRVFTVQAAIADNVAQYTQDQPERIAQDTFKELPGNIRIRYTWEYFYDIINLANAVITKGPNIKNGDKDLIARAIGEAKFLRAMTYFLIVKLWGGVPLRLKPTEDFSKVIVPTSPAPKVYDRVIQDLNNAADVLPTSYDGNKNNEVGRATKYAALTLLGKVYLQKGEKDKAKQALNKVLGKYSLLNDYSKIYAAGNKNSAESIFEISYNPSNQTGLPLNTAFIPTSVASKLGIPRGGSTPIRFFPTQDLADAYENGDLRKDASIGRASANGDSDHLYISKFIDTKAGADGANIDLVQLRYADVLLMLAEAIGESSQSYGYINQVRKRAGLGKIGSNTPGTFTEKLQHERRVEFAFEQHRWFDLLRLPDKKIIDIMETQLKKQTGKKISIPKYKLLLPIPLLEVNRSDGKVKQNPGWS
jgi:tetratricopeptide (TPR) repeat protein